MKCIAKTFYGMEPLLADEIKTLGGRNVRSLRRAVEFGADKALIYKLNLQSRYALNFMIELVQFNAVSESDFYRSLKKIPWSKYLNEHKSFLFRFTGKAPWINHSNFPVLRAKDALVDYFTGQGKARPSVDTSYPDLKFQLHVQGNRCKLLLDSSGVPLFKRGYKVPGGRAPINEVLAAGLIGFSGWKGNTDLMDPMCGSGTIVIEAAMMAHNIPPGYKRRFGFQNWLDYNADLWDRIYKSEIAKIKDVNVSITGMDISQPSIDLARENAISAEVNRSIKFAKKDFFKSEKRNDGKLTIIMNPPYDERLKEDEIFEFYKEIGNTLKFQFPDSDAWIISANRPALKRIGLKPDKRLTLYNGKLECGFNKYSIFGGKRKEFLSQKV